MGKAQPWRVSGRQAYFGPHSTCETLTFLVMALRMRARIHFATLFFQFSIKREFYRANLKVGWFWLHCRKGFFFKFYVVGGRERHILTPVSYFLVVGSHVTMSVAHEREHPE